MTEPIASENSSIDKARLNDAMLQLVSFKMVGETYALPILDVKEIIRLAEVTPVPNAPHFVEGVLNLRGQILPVVDLRKRFNLPAQEATDSTRIMVIEIGENFIGLIVDAVEEVLRIPSMDVAPPPPMVSKGIGSEYLKGITHQRNRMIVLVDIQRVFHADELGDLGGF